jgi:hypothetical protein
MKYYAQSLPGMLQKGWQLLVGHVENVAEMKKRK